MEEDGSVGVRFQALHVLYTGYGPLCWSIDDRGTNEFTFSQLYSHAWNSETAETTMWVAHTIDPVVSQRVV